MVTRKAVLYKPGALRLSYTFIYPSTCSSILNFSMIYQGYVSFSYQKIQRKVMELKWLIHLCDRGWIFRCLHYESRVQLHLRCWHPMWAALCALSAPFLIRIPANDLGRQRRLAHVLGLLPHVRVLMAVPASWLWLSSASPEIHVRDERADWRPLALPPLRCSVSQINNSCFILKKWTLSSKSYCSFQEVCSQ